MNKVTEKKIKDCRDISYAITDNIYKIESALDKSRPLSAGNLIILFDTTRDLTNKLNGCLNDLQSK